MKLSLDPKIEKKIDELLSKMTLEEKLGQMNQVNGGQPGYNDQVKKGKIGSILSLWDPARFNELQAVAVKESRLGIPLILGIDVIHGFRTIFPIPLAESCAWNPEMSKEAASLAAKEAVAYGIRWTFAPMMDIARDARWGRIAEGSGEDPYLGSVLAKAKVEGFQGDDLSNPEKIAACAKHYVGYGAAEGGMDYNTTEISEDALRNVYLPPFHAAVEAGTATIMSAFNDLNGIPTSGNRHTLMDILRKEWGFQGFVVSDWASVQQMVSHGYAADDAEAALKGVLTGVDMDMASQIYPEHLQKWVKEGKVAEKVLDESVRRILRIKFKLGLFEKPYAPLAKLPGPPPSAEHLKAAREAGRQCAVLLKNEGSLLPLKKDLGSLAVIGPLADHSSACLGCWSLAGKPEEAVTILSAIRSQVSKATKVLHAKGCEPSGGDESGFAEAVQAAKQADVVLLVVGETSEMSGEGHSRAYLGLPGLQEKLVEEMIKTGKPIAVALMSGRPLAIPRLVEKIPAILEVWQLGSQHGPAVADVLFGDFNPCGRLTASFPRTTGQVPVHYNHKNSGRPNNPADAMTVGYCDLPVTPQFPFGYGLSYTTFKYSGLELSSKTMGPQGSLIVSAEVQNTGAREGVEVVQLYLRDVAASVTRPVRELKGFQRISLKAGEKTKVTFTIHKKDLGFYRTGHGKAAWVTEPGEFKVWIGPNSAEGLEGIFWYGEGETKKLEKKGPVVQTFA